MTPSTSCLPSAMRLIAFARTSCLTGREAHPLALSSPRVEARVVGKSLPGFERSASAPPYQRPIVTRFTIPLRTNPFTRLPIRDENGRRDLDRAGRDLDRAGAPRGRRRRVRGALRGRARPAPPPRGALPGAVLEVG